MKLTCNRFRRSSVESLPTRECGLKSEESVISLVVTSVTPYAGVWIEIIFILQIKLYDIVTPYAGVWIEIYHKQKDNVLMPGHSLRGSVD